MLRAPARQDSVIRDGGRDGGRVRSHGSQQDSGCERLARGTGCPHLLCSGSNCNTGQRRRGAAQACNSMRTDRFATLQARLCRCEGLRDGAQQHLRVRDPASGGGTESSPVHPAPPPPAHDCRHECYLANPSVGRGVNCVQGFAFGSSASASHGPHDSSNMPSSPGRKRTSAAQPADKVIKSISPKHWSTPAQG